MASLLNGPAHLLHTSFKNGLDIGRDQDYSGPAASLASSIPAQRDGGM
ncbi:hypothetical protein [Nonomuraea polychroma]|nr:hypothetical protein [Nonomuraea polychroma]